MTRPRGGVSNSRGSIFLCIFKPVLVKCAPLNVAPEGSPTLSVA